MEFRSNLAMICKLLWSEVDPFGSDIKEQSLFNEVSMDCRRHYQP